MNSRELVFSLYRASGLTNSEYAKLLGLSRQTLWDRINTMKAKDMTVSVLNDMVTALGYCVVVVKDNSIPNDAYVLE